MARRPLNNDDWLYESNCFVCENANEAGLQIDFFADDEAGEVVATFQLDHRFSGAPTLLHGGVVLSVLDEVQAWATIALAGKLALTHKTECTFDQPVKVDKEYTAVGSVQESDAGQIRTNGEIRDANGSVMARSSSTFVVLGEAKVREFVDAADDEDVHHRDFLK